MSAEISPRVQPKGADGAELWSDEDEGGVRRLFRFLLDKLKLTITNHPGKATGQ